jgi:hypothetical protein
VSGCCGQGPVIVTGAAATPRLDAEAVLLCDVLTDGTVAAVALVEPVYDTSTGERVSTRTVDPVTGAAYTPVGTLQPCQPDGCNATTTSQILCDTAADGTATTFVRATTYDCAGALLGTLDRTLDGTPYTPAGTVGVCPSSPDCDSPTTPTATIGLCLADGTPIAVTVVRDCNGAITSEGWINLTTGAYSAGAPPAGTVACGTSRSVQVSGTFCDIDAAGDVVGLVLVEYTYADDGTIASVRLVDAVTGTTYTPTGTVTVCPAGVEQPERDLVQLCDVAVDGTSTAFVRDYARDENGAITGHSDYALDGTSYVTTGTVGMCGQPCRDSATVLLCDVPADSTTTITPTIVDGAVADVGQSQFQNHAGPYTDLWAGTTFLYPAGAGPDQEHLAATGQLTADMAGCDGASGTVTISVRVRNDGPDTGQAWDGALRLFRGTTAIAAHNALEWAPPGWQGTLTVSAPVTAADIAAGDIRVALILETYHLGAKSWTADQFTAAIELEGCEVTSSTQFLRTLVTDCESGEVVSTVDTTLDGQPYTVTGVVGQCTPAEPGTDPVPPEQDVVELCDVQADGTVVPLVRDYRRDATGAVIGYSDYGLEGTPYTATGTVGRCCTDVVDTRCVRLVTDDVEIVTGADWVVYSDPTTPTAMPVETSLDNAISALPAGTDTVGAEHFVGFLYSPSNIGGGTAYLHVSQLAAPGAEILGLYFAGEYVGRETGWWRLPYEGQQHIVIHYRTTSVIANAPVVAATLSLADSLNNGSGADREYTRTTYCDGRVEYRDSGSNLVPNPVTSLVAPCFDRYEPVNAQCATTAVQTVRLCDLDPTVEADEDGRRCAVPFLRHLAYDCAGELAGFHDTGLDGTTPYTPVQVVDCQCASGQGITSSIEVPWQTVSVVEDPAGVAGQDFIYAIAPETDPTRIGTIRVHVSRPAGGACGAYDINNLVFSNTAAYTLTLDAVAQEMSYLRVDLMDFDTFEPVAINTAYPLPDRLGGTAGWNATNNRIVPSESNGTGYMYWDNPPETVGWSVLNQGGGTSCSALSFQGMTVEPGGCCGGDSDGCGQCAPVNTAIRRLASAGTFDAATLGTLQSVTVTVLAGSAAVATNDGTGEVPAGASLSWSVVNDIDTGLGMLTITTDAGDDVLVTATYK